MEEYDLYNFIRTIIHQEIQHTMLANIDSTKDVNRASVRRFPTESPVGNLRRIQPYGFASRPKPGGQCVVSSIGGNTTHLIITGDYDDKRPSLNEGESILYGADGQVIFLKTGKEIHIGSKTASEPLVLGNILKNFSDQLIGKINDIIDAINTGPVAVTTVPGFPAPTNPALIAALNLIKIDLLLLKTNLVDTATTNFLSKKNFTERGA